MENWRTVIEKIIENQEAIINELKENKIEVPQRVIGRLDDLFEKKSGWF